jgi:hypothetical protein
LWLVEVVSDVDGPTGALAVLRRPGVLSAVLERSGTSLRPLSSAGISLYLNPLVHAAGESVLDLLSELAASDTLETELAEALREALRHPPRDP